MKAFRIIILGLITLACIATEVWLSVPGLWQMMATGGEAIPVKRVAMAALAVTIPPAAATCWRTWRHLAARGATLVIAGLCWVFALSIAIEGAYATAKQKASIASAPADKVRADWMAADERVKDKTSQIQRITENRPSRQLKSMAKDDSVERTKSERKKLSDAIAAATEKERLQAELAALESERTALALKIGTTDGSATLIGQMMGGISNQEVIEVGQSLLLLLVVSLLPEGVRHTWPPPHRRVAVARSPFERWAAAHIVADANSWTKSKEAAGHYARWVKQEGLEPDGAFHRMFAAHCEDLGGAPRRRSNDRGWRGIRLEK